MKTSSTTRIPVWISLYWPAALLVLIGMATYANSLHGPFIYDDSTWIDMNPYIRKLWPFYHLFLAPTNNPLKGRPVVSLSIAVNYALSGRNVIGYHLVNIMVHLLAALTLMGIVHRTLKLPQLKDKFSDAARGLAFSCALLWMVHPVQTECVNYITQRTESIMGLFYFLTLYCAIRAREQTRRRWWTASAIAACTLGMASKEVMVTAPFMVFLYDMVYRDNPAATMVRCRWRLYAGLAATWIVVATLLIAFPFQHVVGFSTEVTSWQYLKCQSLVIVDYLRTILWPDVLAVDYGHPQHHEFRDVAASGLLIVALLSITVWTLISHPFWGYLGAWFFVTLSPTSSFVPLPSEVAAERRLYLPLASIAVLLVVGGYVGLQRVVSSSTVRHRVSIVLLLVTVGLCAGRTWLRNHQYSNPVSLWSEAVRKAPHNARGINNLGLALYKNGETDRAIDHLNKALQLDSNYFPIHSNLGNIHWEQGQFEKAIRHYQTAVSLDPESSEARNNLANALCDLGKANQAIIHLRTTLEHEPEYAPTHNNLGNALTDLGQLDEALRHYEIAIRLDPEFGTAHYNLAIFHRNRGNIDAAILHFERAVDCEPRNADAHFNLGNALLQKGMSEAAIDQLRSALRLEPRLVGAHINLGIVLQQQGQTAEAIQHFEAALRIRPNSVHAHYNLATIFHLEQGKIDDAIFHYQAAIRADPNLAVAHNNLGKIFLLRGQRDLAIQRFREALRLKNDFLDAQQNLNQALGK